MRPRTKDMHVVIQDFTYIFLYKAWWWPFSAETCGLFVTVILFNNHGCAWHSLISYKNITGCLLLKIRIANHLHCHNSDYHCMNLCRYETADLSIKFFSRTWTKFRIESQKQPLKLRSFIYIICLRVVTNLWMIRCMAETLPCDDVKGKAIPFEAWRGPWGSRGLRLPEILCSRHMKVVCPTPQPPPPPQPPRGVPGTNFCSRKNPNDPRSASTNCATVYLMIFRIWLKILVYHAK